MNRADAGLPPDPRGGGSTTFAKTWVKSSLGRQLSSAKERFCMIWRLKHSSIGLEIAASVLGIHGQNGV